MRLYYLGKPADGYGWGVCNTNLVAALAKQCELIVCNDEKRKRYESPCLIPIGNHKLEPIRKFNAPLRLGYTFFESPLPDCAPDNAAKFDWIFAGSTWCTDGLKARGINHCETLIQGVDSERFAEQPWTDRRGFRVFSGGKYEYRKSQDIVCAAMAIFMRDHPDAVLVNQWHNPWAWAMQSMARSTLLKEWKNPLANMEANRIVTVPATPNKDMPTIYGYCDVGFFPNRCEGGTNLPMMELMACGRPVIATVHTGHADMVGDCTYKLTQGSFDRAGWWHNDVSDCLVQLTRAYNDRAELKRRGHDSRALVTPFSWQKCAATILARVQLIHESRRRS